MEESLNGSGCSIKKSWALHARKVQIVSFDGLPLIRVSHFGLTLDAERVCTPDNP